MIKIWKIKLKIWRLKVELRFLEWLLTSRIMKERV